ncbi:MAG: sulfatase [Proteobacteria bacterium]|nr:sulfatase [Pseudomonadota bacterium]
MARDSIDLVERFDGATTTQTTRLVNFGLKAARRHMVSGWAGHASRLDGGGLGTWSVGDAVTIDFFVGSLEDRELTFRCAASGPVTVEFRVNGSPWQVLELAPSLTEYHLQLPASLQRLGSNRLRVLHPASPGSAEDDERVLWNYLRLGSGELGKLPRPVARRDIGTLFIPYGTQIDYTIEVSEDDVLAFDEIRVQGSATGRLQVGRTGEGGEEVILTEDLSSIPELWLGSGGRRLSLFAIAGEDTSGVSSAGVVLFSPRISHRGVDDASRDVSAELRVSPTGPNVVVYLIDTLRRDHLGCYGYDRNTSPRIDAFARDAFLFENAEAQSPWTRPSVASLFTGLWPQVHGVVREPDALSDDAVTLAETFRGLGYRTAAITANGMANHLFGFAQGFDYFKYVHMVRPPDPLATSAEVNAAVFSWLADHAQDQPFFLYIHTIDPHGPYEPPEPYRARFAVGDDPEVGTPPFMVDLNAGKLRPDAETVEALRALYDAEIAFNDASFGQLLDELSRRSLYDQSLIVLLSDHGEEFHEHGGWTHGKTLYAELLEIPLLLKLPNGGEAVGREAERSRGGAAEQGPRRISAMARQVDVAPTILDVIGAELPAGVQGRSLLPLMQGDGRAGGDAWVDRSIAHLDFLGNAAVSLVDGSWKLIQRGGDPAGSPELYDRARDPLEQRDLAAEEPALVRSLAKALHEAETSAGDGLAPSPVDPAAVERISEELRALGYLSPGSGGAGTRNH